MTDSQHLLLALDQSTDCTGYSVSDLDTGAIIEVGAIATPTAQKHRPRTFQARRIHELIRWWNSGGGEGDTLDVAIEATYLSEHGRNKSAVTTLQELSKLAGAIEYACDIECVPCHTIPLYNFNQYLHLPLQTKRLPRKLASLRAARILCADSLPKYADAFSQAVRLIENWLPNADGQPKTPEAILSRASKLLLSAVDCTVDTADAVVIGAVARGMLIERELAKGTNNE